MVESSDTRDLKALDSNIVPVQVRSAAPNQSANFDTKTALRFGGLFLRLRPETVYSCGFRAFLFLRLAVQRPTESSCGMAVRREYPKGSEFEPLSI